MPLLLNPEPVKPEPSTIRYWARYRIVLGRNMSSIESPVETVARFIPSWRNSDPRRLSEEIISVFNETNRNPDPFKLIFRKGVVCDFKTGEPVKIDRSSCVSQKEGEFFDALRQWLGENNSGAALWISPLLPGVYPCNKITVYQIISAGDEERVTLNTSFLLDTPLAHCLAIASRLNPAFKNCTNPEALRNKLFDVGENFDLLELLKLASVEVNSKQSPGQEVIGYFMGLIYLGHDPRFIAERMYQKGVIGERAVSCGRSGTFMDNRAFIMNFTGFLVSPGSESGKFVKRCGACGTKIGAKISKGYKCSNCGGVYEGC